MRGRIGIILGFVALVVGPAAAQRSTQIVISQPADATTMDPGRSSQVLTVNYFFNLYDTLTRWDAALKLHPGLATSWKAINDTTWEVRLRPDVKFHDGSPLTAEDVKAVYERNMVPGKTVVQSGFATLESVQAVNPTTLRIVTRKPDPLVPVRMAQMGGSIYPARFTSDEGARELARKPIGSGAYKFVSWTKDDQLVMEANRDWWGWNGKPPAVDRVIWKPIPDDFARLSALQRGEVDVITNVPPDQMKIVRTLTVSSTRTLTFWINTTQPPTQDKRVRQALHYAMDVNSIVKNLYAGQGKPFSGGLADTDFGYNPALKPYPHDPERARKLLAEAGYANGIDITLYAGSGTMVNDKQLLEALADAVPGGLRYGCQAAGVVQAARGLSTHRRRDDADAVRREWDRRSFTDRRYRPPGSGIARTASGVSVELSGIVGVYMQAGLVP